MIDLKRMNRGLAAKSGLGRHKERGGFTLIELLVVITIILVVSAVALPTVLPALSHRQVSEAARILQAVLAGARDAAIRDNNPSGIRLLPDPNFSGLTNGVLDNRLPLAYNRIVPIGPAPEYSEGFAEILNPGLQADLVPTIFPVTTGLIYPVPNTIGGSTTGLTYPYSTLAPAATPGLARSNVLMVVEGSNLPRRTARLSNPSTSWFSEHPASR